VGRYDDKTERATPRRRREAREEGQVARSPEVSVALSLLAGLAAVRLLAPTATRAFADGSRELFRVAGSGVLDTQLLTDATRDLLVLGIAPFLGAATLGAVAGGVAQVGFRITPKAAKPKLKHLSPKQGLEKLRPSHALWELGRTALKLGLLAAVVTGPIREFVGGMDRAHGLLDGIALAYARMTTILVRAVLLMVFIAALDYGVNRYRHERQMKMSREDVKQEHRTQEGDPQVKAQRRRRANELSRNRMISMVANADVVLTNPTHFAVALRYDEAEGAPRVLAKGTDRMALRIRREAYRHGVLVVEDKPLARALYRRCRVDQFIPTELYEAVAVVLATVYRRRSRMRRVAA
jgi:flagellar biosynthesis protein FlhB